MLLQWPVTVARRDNAVSQKTDLQHHHCETLNLAIRILLEHCSFVPQLSQNERRFCLRQSDSLFHSVEGKSQLAIWETQFCSRLHGLQWRAKFPFVEYKLLAPVACKLRLRIVEYKVCLMTLYLMTADYKVCLVPVTCKLLLDNCGAQRLFSAREIQSLRGDSKVGSSLRASGVQTFAGDNTKLFGESGINMFVGGSEARRFLCGICTNLCFVPSFALIAQFLLRTDSVNDPCKTVINCSLIN